jgi:hypothetical protein
VTRARYTAGRAVAVRGVPNAELTAEGGRQAHMSRRHVGIPVAPELTGAAATPAIWVPHELLERSRNGYGTGARTSQISPSPVDGQRGAPVAFAWGRDDTAQPDGRHHSAGGPMS